jgi:hypothetical protein
MSALLILTALAFVAGLALGNGAAHKRAYPLWRQRLRDIATAQTFRPTDGLRAALGAVEGGQP